MPSREHPALEDRLRAILAADPVRIEALTLVRSLDLPDGWIGAGFVRDAVWDHLHGRTFAPPIGDVDIVWYDPRQTSPELDREFEDRLKQANPAFDWSVKNQARMHHRNTDSPYQSVNDAMRFWPETATAVAVRLTSSGTLDICAPFGLCDLFGLVIRPTPTFESERRATFDQRVSTKAWLSRYPLLKVA